MSIENKPNISEKEENWRFKKHAGRPKVEYNFKENKSEKREPKLPEKLYRQIPFADLYFLWRDNELPLQHHQGSIHSQVEQDSIGNFWFTQPVTLNSLEGYIITEPTKWKNLPEYVQESSMGFKSEKKSREMGQWADWYPRGALSYVKEIHTGNRLSLDEITVCIPQHIHNKAEKIITTLKNLSSEKKSKQDEEELIFTLRQIEERELGKSSNYQETIENIKQQLQNPQTIENLTKFYQWLLTLPIIPSSLRPLDIEDVVNDPERQKENEKKFLEFYNSIK